MPDILSNILSPERKHPDWVVVIAAGTGGPQALAQVLQQFPRDFPGVVIVTPQVRPGFTRVLADQYSHVCNMPVHEPMDGGALQSSRILVCPSNVKLSIENMGGSHAPAYCVILEDVMSKAESHRTRIDDTMKAIASVYGKYTIGVLMTGMGNDGCEGLKAIGEAGGITLVQDEASCVVCDLPMSAVQQGITQEVVPLYSIADRIMNIVTGEENNAAAA